MRNTKKEKIVIFGASMHTKYTIDIVEQVDDYEILGILDYELKKGAKYAGYDILGKDEDLPEIIRKYNVKKGIIAIGDNYIRSKVSKKVFKYQKDFSFIRAIHPSVILGKDVTIGAGSVIMAGVIINNDTRIGSQCFIATKASIDHDSCLGDHSSLSPGVTTGGSVEIGYCTAIGIGANIIHGKKIGNHTIVGAGSLVTKNIGDNVVSYGVPAKMIRKRKNGERYL